MFSKIIERPVPVPKSSKNTSMYYGDLEIKPSDFKKSKVRF